MIDCYLFILCTVLTAGPFFNAYWWSAIWIVVVNFNLRHVPIEGLNDSPLKSPIAWLFLVLRGAGVRPGETTLEFKYLCQVETIFGINLYNLHTNWDKPMVWSTWQKKNTYSRPSKDMSPLLYYSRRASCGFHLFFIVKNVRYPVLWNPSFFGPDPVSGSDGIRISNSANSYTLRGWIGPTRKTHRLLDTCFFFNTQEMTTIRAEIPPHRA